MEGIPKGGIVCEFEIYVWNLENNSIKLILSQAAILRAYDHLSGSVSVLACPLR